MLLTEEQNKKNESNLIDLLDYFDLNEESLEYLRENIWTRTEDALKLDSLLKLGDDLRHYIPIEITQNNTENPMYNKYRELLYSKYKLIELEENKIDLRYFSEDVLNRGRVVHPKTGNEVKLFKHLIKLGYPREEIEKITTYKPPMDKMYLVLSRNPVDYLFSSTNQSFSSCIGLSSSHSPCYYLGFPGIFNDNARCLAYLTKGKVSDFEIKGLNFSHYRYISRSWVIFGEGNFNIERYYPDKKQCFEEHIKGITKYGSGNIKKSTPSKVIHNSNGERLHVYMDRTEAGLDDLEDNYIYGWDNPADSGEGIMNTTYDHGGGFESISSFDDIRRGGRDFRWFCRRCDEGIHDGDEYSLNGDTYCESCYNEVVRYCDECGYEGHSSEFNDTCDGTLLCASCLADSEYTLCSRCGEAHLEVHTITNVLDNTRNVCYDCFERYTQCRECGGYFLFNVSEDICFKCSSSGVSYEGATPTPMSRYIRDMYISDTL